MAHNLGKHRLGVQPLQVTLLGKYSPFPPMDGATAGMLLSDKQTNILIDCGSGVLSRMQRLIAIPRLSAIVLTHLTSDRIVDMAVLRNALISLKVRGGLRNGPLKVFMPGFPRVEHATISAGQNAFEIIEVSDGMTMQLGSLSISFHAMRHPIPSFGLRASDPDHRTFAYTGDTSYHDALIPFATRTDLFLCDAALLERERPGLAASHMTAMQAGAVARDANVKRLICTNLHPFASEKDIRAEATRYFPRAEIANEMQTYFA